MDSVLALSRLDQLEQVIEAGLETFMEVGQSLLEIRRDRLYRQRGFSTFEAYCSSRWGFRKSQANRLMDAAEVVQSLKTSPIGEVFPLPTNEAQTRELVPLFHEDEEAAREVWQDLRREHGSKVTAALIREAVSARIAADEYRAAIRERERARAVSNPPALSYESYSGPARKAAYDNGQVSCYLGDACSVLPDLPDNSIDCVVTSPPYWGLRDYGVSEQLGLEATPEEYVERLVAIFREVRRVVKPTGELWLNIGDSYAGSGKGFGATDHGKLGRHANEFLPPPLDQSGIAPKNLIGIPWMVAFALRAAGWYLRMDCIWSKPNCMPESVSDRPTKSHEYLFLLSKSADYFYDATAIKEPAHDWGTRDRRRGKYTSGIVPISGGAHHGLHNGNSGASGRNKRSVWTIATQPYSEAHFAVMPEALVEPCILASTSAVGNCPECGSPWRRVLDQVTTDRDGDGPARKDHHNGIAQPQSMWRKGDGRAGYVHSATIGWRPTCDHEAPPVLTPSVVLDPFCGTGTTLKVAQQLGRRAIGIEINPEYLPLIEKRCSR